MPRTRKPNPRDFDRPKLCGGKRIYGSRHLAELTLEEQEIMNSDLKLKVYRCLSGCGGWHLTRARQDLDGKTNMLY